MSRTDKTAPIRVKAFYYPDWVVESHDHVKGFCDLPERPTPTNVEEYKTWWKVDGEWVDTHPDQELHWRDRRSFPSDWACHWKYSLVMWCTSLATGCGCPMCNRNPYYETRLRKRERMEAKRYVRGGWLKEY